MSGEPNQLPPIGKATVGVKMFATLKNKIKEETGEDVATTASQQQQRHPINNNNNYRLRSRRVSINSNSADDVGGGGGIYNEV